MRIAYDNILEYASSLIATNESPNRQVVNLLHPYLAKIFQSVGTPPTFQSIITASFTSPKEANCVVYGNHNVQSMSLTFRDQFDSIITNFPVQVYQGNRFYEFSSLITGIFKIEINLISFIPIEIGSLFITKFLEMPRFNQGPQYSISLRSASFVSGSGQSSGNAAVNLNNFPFSWTDIDCIKLNEIVNYLEFVQTSKPHWIDPYPDLEEAILQPDEKSSKFPTQYVQIQESQIPQPKRRLRNWKYNLNIEYREAR